MRAQAEEVARQEASVSALLSHIATLGTQGRVDVRATRDLLKQAVSWHEAPDFTLPAGWLLGESEREVRHWGVEALGFAERGEDVVCTVLWRQGDVPRRTEIVMPSGKLPAASVPACALFWARLLGLLYDLTHRQAMLVGEAPPVTRRTQASRSRPRSPGRRAPRPEDDSSLRFWRRGHVRRIQGSAGEEAQRLAREDLGRELGPGETYVRGHLARAGKHEGLVLVRLQAGEGALSLRWGNLLHEA